VAELTLWVDGQERRLDGDDPFASLAWALRDDGHTAVKVGCEEGACGSCIVLVDDEPVPACVVPLATLSDGTRIETARGLIETPSGRAVTAALARAEPLQCGFCGPGMLATCVAHLREHGALPAESAAMRDLLSSHLCRCTAQAAVADALAGVAAEEGVPIANAPIGVAAEETARP
jgi:aerobic-type carbon monoxide dehydrogenase small subunit (CoxS/CutS family)